MSEYVTVWPGSEPPPGYAPMSAMQAMHGRQPMFAADPGPRYTGPFNTGTPADGIMHMLLPQLLQMMTQGRHMPAQFFPQQQLYDQREATRYFNASQQAMAVAARRDAGTVNDMLGGLTEMMTGRPLTDVQRSRNFRMASGVSQFTPLLINMLGPDLVDQLHGTRGSATVLSQQLHNAMRTAIDPISHTVGYSGESAGRLSQEIFERNFGKGADLGVMKGMSAGQAGILVNELQARGMLGRPMGLLSVDEQRSLLPRTLRDDTISRLAETLPEIQEILKSGGTPNENALTEAKAKIRETHKKLTDPTVQFTAKDLKDYDKLPGGEEIIRAGDADRIADRLKNMSGVVRAMRDIFGDMGNPNAPMRDIINGLEELTQNGLATMSAGQLEMMVRRTHNIAKQTGIGVQGMMGLMAGGAAMSDRLGLDRSYVPMIAQQSALFGAAAGDHLRLDIPVWGAASKEQLLLTDQQLRTHASASPLANQLNATLRMMDTGIATPDAGTELAAMMQAVKLGQTEYTHDGKTNSILMSHNRLLQMLKRDAGVGATEAYAVMSDIQGNQEYGPKYNTPDLVRRIMPQEAVRKLLQPMIGSRLRGLFNDSGMSETLKETGVADNEKELRELTLRLGQGVGTDWRNMDSATNRDPAAKQAYLGASLRKRLWGEIRAKYPNATEAEIDAMTDRNIEKLGGAKGLSDAGSVIQATINQAASTNPAFRTEVQMFGVMNMATMGQAAARGRQAEIAGLTQSAMAGLGTADPIRRLSDAFQNANKDTPFGEVVVQGLGAVNVDAVNAADPQGPLAQIFGLVQANKDLDANDPKQLEQARRNSAMLQGLINGGATAAAQLKLLDAAEAAGQPKNELLRRHLEAASKRDSNTSLLGDLGYSLSANVSIDQIAAIQDSGKDMRRVLSDDAASAADRTAVATKYLLGSKERAKQLLNDERSMEIIGQGGLALVQGTIADVDRIQELVKTQSEATGHAITFDDILSGKNGVSDDAHSEAMKIQDRMDSNWKEIAKRRGYAMLPGKGDDPENKNRAAMTEQEKEDLGKYNAFNAQYSTPEERASAAVEGLLAIASVDQRARMATDVNRKELVDEMTKGDRGRSMFQAIHGRQELLELGIKKGVFNGKTRLDELTDAEEAEVMKRLEKANLSESERADMERHRRDAAILDGFGDETQSANTATADTVKRIRQAPASMPDHAPTNADKKVEMVMTGSVDIREDGKADIKLEGASLWSAFTNAMGVT